jgi:uncharacterized membrane protein YuzA (DUF378 family)
MNTLLTIAEVLVGIAAAYVIVKYLVLPAIRKEDSSGKSSGGTIRRDRNDLP